MRVVAMNAITLHRQDATLQSILEYNNRRREALEQNGKRDERSII
jgi:hypothetical protein